MKRRFVGIGSILLAGTMLAWGSGAAAQTAPAPQEAEAPPQDAEATSQEVIVTANRRAERLIDVANSITAIRTEDLFRRNELSLVNIQAQVPGLAIQQQNPGQTRITIRGQNSGGSGATVTTVVDDVPFSATGSTGNGAIITADINPYDLARIEVLRGPQGTLYGAGAEGGIIKYVTNKPDPRRIAAGGEVGVETVESGETGYAGRAFFNLPLGGKAAFRASGFYESLAGFVDNRTAGLNDANDGERYGGRAQLRFQPTDNFTIDIAGFYQKLRTNGDSTVNVLGAPNITAPPANPFALANGLNFNAYFPSRQEVESWYTYVSLDYDVGPVRLTSLTSYGRIASLRNSEGSGTLAAPGVTFGDFLEAFVYGQPFSANSFNGNTLRKFNQELRVASPEGATIFGLPVEWQFGGFYTYEKQNILFSFNAFARPSGTPLPVPALGTGTAPGSYEEIAGFGEATLHFTPQFDISFGGRFSHNSQAFRTIFTAGLFTGADSTLVSPGSSEDAGTFSVAPRFKFDKNTVLYGRIARGFRPGGPTAPIAGAPPSYPASYLSDRTTNYELGFRADLLNKKLSIDIAGFYIDWSRIQVATLITTPAGNFTVTGNGGKARTVGFEWNLTGRPTNWLTVGVVGSVTDAELREDAPALGGIRGQKLAYVPDVTNTVNVDLDRKIGSNGLRAFLGTSWTYNGRRFTDIGLPGLSQTYQRLPAYSVFALRAGVENDRWLAQVYVNNLTNEIALTSYTSSGAIGPLGIASIIRPRTIGLRIAVKY